MKHDNTTIYADNRRHYTNSSQPNVGFAYKKKNFISNFPELYKDNFISVIRIRIFFLKINKG